MISSFKAENFLPILQVLVLIAPAFPSTSYPFPFVTGNLSLVSSSSRNVHTADDFIGSITCATEVPFAGRVDVAAAATKHDLFFGNFAWIREVSARQGSYVMATAMRQCITLLRV